MLTEAPDGQRRSLTCSAGGCLASRPARARGHDVEAHGFARGGHLGDDSDECARANAAHGRATGQRRERDAHTDRARRHKDTRHVGGRSDRDGAVTALAC
jgi:hypothetical protein